MGREPGAGLMRVLEGRAEAVAGMFNAQYVANTLWAACVLSLLCASDAEFRRLNPVVQRLVSLDKPACFKSAGLSQLHQFFLSFSAEMRLPTCCGAHHLEDMQSLKEACPAAFEGEQTNSSATHLQVSETLCHTGLSRFAAQGRGMPLMRSCTTVPLRLEARGAVRGSRGQWA
jgi:hypothetical protein